ncbi:MAG: hypothetical protein ACK5CE_05960, partial [Actinomycetes bacterium]
VWDLLLFPAPRCAAGFPYPRGGPPRSGGPPAVASFVFGSLSPGVTYAVRGDGTAGAMFTAGDDGVGSVELTVEHPLVLEIGPVAR